VTTRRLPSPPDPFPKLNTLTMSVGTTLHRTHLSHLKSAQFNPCLGLPTRFAPFKDMSDECVPSLYAATSLEGASFESIFHDIKPAARFKTVPLSVLMARSVSEIACERDLKLAKLFAPDLKLWKIQRTDIIETPKSTYDQTVLWARAIHHVDSTLDGLVWTSRQCDPDLCVVLFGDRVTANDFKTISCIDVSKDDAVLVQLRSFAARAGITFTV
jgi:hypothetical protein